MHLFHFKSAHKDWPAAGNASISLNILDLRLGLNKYAVEFWWKMAQLHVYMQRLINALLATTSSRERPLYDCPILAGIFQKWAPSGRKPLLLPVGHANPRQINLDHWKCGTMSHVTKTFHSERLIILIIQRNHKNADRNQDPGDVSIQGHATW